MNEDDKNWHKCLSATKDNIAFRIGTKYLRFNLYLNMFRNFNYHYCILNLLTHIFGCFSIYFADDDFVRVETCRRNISDKWLFIIDCATCWIKSCIIPHIVSSFLCFSPILSFTFPALIPFILFFIMVCLCSCLFLKFYYSQ